MIVHHAHRLHEGVADRAAHKLETSPFQVLAHGIRFRGLRRDFLDRLPGVLLWLVADKSPNVLVKRAEFVLHGQEHFRILDGSLDLQPVADDPGIGQQAPSLFLAVLGDDGRIEIVEGFPVVLSFFQNRLPTQTRLRLLRGSGTRTGVGRHGPARPIRYRDTAHTGRSSPTGNGPSQPPTCSSVSCSRQWWIWLAALVNVRLAAALTATASWSGSMLSRFDFFQTPRGWTRLIRLPQVSSNRTTLTGPIAVGSPRKLTPSPLRRWYSASMFFVKNAVAGMPASNRAF